MVASSGPCIRQVPEGRSQSILHAVRSAAAFFTKLPRESRCVARWKTSGAFCRGPGMRSGLSTVTEGRGCPGGIGGPVAAWAGGEEAPIPRRADSGIEMVPGTHGSQD